MLSWLRDLNDLIDIEISMERNNAERIYDGKKRKYYAASA